MKITARAQRGKAHLRESCRGRRPGTALTHRADSFPLTHWPFIHSYFGFAPLSIPFIRNRRESILREKMYDNGIA